MNVPQVAARLDSRVGGPTMPTVNSVVGSQRPRWHSGVVFPNGVAGGRGETRFAAADSRYRELLESRMECGPSGVCCQPRRRQRATCPDALEMYLNGQLDQYVR